MTFYDRYELLCSEKGLKAQSQEMIEVTGVKSPSISGWKNGSMPKVESLCRLASYFDVTTDYLLGLSPVRKPSSLSLSEEEMLLLNAYRNANAQGRFHIIQVCMNEKDAAEKGESVSAG